MRHALFVLSVWIHISAAATWIGGSLFLVVVLVPTTREPAFRNRGTELIRRVARRFQWVVWICFGLLIATGIVNLLVYGGMSLDFLATRGFWSSSYGTVLAWKLVMVGVILVLSAGHDFALGPLLAKASGEDATSNRAARLRLALRWGGRLNLFLGVIVIGLGVALTRGWPW
ncbi:MAG: CopD family protein [Vicinamibacterales bacterium]|jgi:uncharacterized membrane protein|nr:CopD family protein [Vicinamibacterales bacterium]HJN42556.1 CopD family protein [Vicinamibacterales bacterium]|tara:strand:+ start:229 stop:744 length:516 start_codon:yes stop_codon:yes gene_type:complete